MDKKEYHKLYYQKNKDKIKIIQKKWAKKNKEKIKKDFLVWYRNNRKNKIKNSIRNLKLNNYSYEKTNKQRKIRSIKRMTRKLYPLKGHFCEFCGKKAIEHHHYTRPIETNKFNYVCHKCHIKAERRMKGGIN